ncbi:MAG: hypothetical protein IPN71_08955 [Fibrobacteres bacterium]|nr:hypothetical protein [Fibrobacterota bacterium]
MQEYVTELLFRIDPQRARALFLEEFKSPPTEGSFTRNAILQALEEQDGSAKELLREFTSDRRYRKDPPLEED